MFASQASLLTLVCLAGHLTALARGQVAGENLDLAAQGLWFIILFSLLLMMYEG